ncbi:extracellular solute-binding protein [Paenibacillus antri]|uniref:Extracellular solute-binding protein n=1 Tax=Paenibacillus antri TaxID=2582848 RepID=A0A5R9G4V8_9BACL|nr:extracellular solute-binding protein [Paenibacillus antri]TLS48538.1 extracellular solute-binding protein [Paenibacillus antri]
MARTFSKSFACLLALTLTITACSGGGSSGGSSNGPAETPPAAEKPAEGGGASAPAESEGLPAKFDPPVTLTVVRGVGSDVKFKDGESIEDNVHTRWAKEKLGIEIKYLWTVVDTNDAFKTKVRLALSANQQFPDVLPNRLSSDVINDLIDSGKFMEVGDAFEKYASQTWKDAMNEDPTVWYPHTRDGKKYGIPILDYAYNGDPVLFIREDWLKKLNLEAPKTLDDLEKVLDAFTNGDPDGNGAKDTFGLTIGFKNWLNTWMADAGWVFGAYGTMPNQWNKDGQGGIEYGSVNPAMKDGLGRIKSWMEKGYISKESALWDEVKATEAFTAGKAGIVAGPHWMPYWPLEDVKKNVPGAEYKAYPIPTGPDGKAGRHGTTNANGVVLLNKDIGEEQLKAFFVYQNYLFDNYANPTAGSEHELGLHQGYDWDIVDGKPTVLTEGQGGFASNKYTLTFDGARIPSLSLTTLAKIARGEEAVTPYEKLQKEMAPATVLEAAKIVMDQKDIVMPSMFTGTPTPTMSSKREFLEKLEKETFSKIIYGEVPLEEFDKFVQDYLKNGGEQIKQEANEWYKSVGGN